MGSRLEEGRWQRDPETQMDLVMAVWLPKRGQVWQVECGHSSRTATLSSILYANFEGHMLGGLHIGLIARGPQGERLVMPLLRQHSDSGPGHGQSYCRLRKISL